MHVATSELPQNVLGNLMLEKYGNKFKKNYENNQQDALYRLIYYSKSALHVSGDVFAQHQEHLTVFTIYGSNLGEHYQIL
jgi:hypothetical protein